jgi:hypothetical protein
MKGFTLYYLFKMQPNALLIWQNFIICKKWVLHFSSESRNKKSDQAKPSRRQRNLSQRRCFACKEKDHNIVDCRKEEVLKQVYQNWMV